jgi:hypothetical protein
MEMAYHHHEREVRAYEDNVIFTTLLYKKLKVHN